MSKSGHAHLYAAAELRTDRDLVFAAVGDCVDALFYAGAELRAGRDIVSRP